MEDWSWYLRAFAELYNDKKEELELNYEKETQKKIKAQYKREVKILREMFKEEHGKDLVESLYSDIDWIKGMFDNPPHKFEQRETTG